MQETEDEIPRLNREPEDEGAGVESRAERELRQGERDRKIEWSDFDAETRAQVAGYLMKRFGVRKDHADDLVSGAMTKLMSRRAVARNPRGLLVTVTLHALYEEQRRMHLHEEHVGMVAADQCAEARNEPIYGQNDVASLVGEQEAGQWQVSALRESLASLSPADRRLLTEYYLGEKPLPEIRSERGWTEDGAKSRLCRARDRLKARLKHMGAREL